MIHAAAQNGRDLERGAVYICPVCGTKRELYREFKP